MDRADLRDWIARDEAAWRSPGTGALDAVFSEDVTYVPSPWAAPVTGLEDLAAFWEEERDGPTEGFTFSASPVAVEGDVGVARVEVAYDDGERWRDLWVVTLAADGRCRAFEEWPFAPDQPDGHG